MSYEKQPYSNKNILWPLHNASLLPPHMLVDGRVLRNPCVWPHCGLHKSSKHTHARSTPHTHTLPPTHILSKPTEPEGFVLIILLSPGLQLSFMAGQLCINYSCSDITNALVIYHNHHISWWDCLFWGVHYYGKLIV